LFGGQWKEKEQHLFYLFSLSPLQILFKPLIFSIVTMVLGFYLCILFLFFDS
jgi:hypothetical protein